MRTRLILLIVAIAVTVGARGQAGALDDTRPAFDVATIKLSTPDETGLSIQMSPVNFATRHSSLRDLIKYAYNIKSSAQISGGPVWMDTMFFDIHAKADASKAESISKLPLAERMAMARLMVQSLLAERFQLKMSGKLEEMPVFALVVAKGGSKLREASPGASPQDQTGRRLGTLKFNGTELDAKGIRISLLVDWLAAQQETGERPVVDQTGLNSNYDFVLSGIAASPGAEDSATSLFTLLKEQLGLTLRAEKAAAQVWVVEHAEPVSAN
jgi:uncharacterized protein (TIGR03435 family)